MQMHGKLEVGNWLVTLNRSQITVAAIATRFFNKFLFILIAVSGHYVHAQTTAAGVMDGDFAVSHSGGATYTIPIKIPPAVAGLIPKITLDYNSQMGNGIVGMGWSLGGLSAITRCGKTVATDGAKGGVNYASSDRYCLEGQRVVLTQGPAYHGSGNYYRTELDKFSRITSVGQANGAAVSFTVESKDGLILEYGGTADSRIEVAGSASVRAWALNRVTDRKGNYYTVTYFEDTVNPQFYPSRIDYTASCCSTAKNSIEFQYEGRPDMPAEYEGGAVIRTALRLKTIVVSAAGSIAYKYQLTYNENPSELFPSRVWNVKQCDGAENCLPSTSFEWVAAGDPGLGGAGSGLWQAYPVIPPKVFTGDFNGDGKADVASYVPLGIWNICLSTGSGFNCSQWQGHTGGTDNNIAGDFNGDGLTDLMAYTGAPGIWQICFSTGSGFDCQNRAAHSGGIPNNVSGDFDGDGKTDIAGYTGADAQWHVCLSRVTSFDCSFWTAHKAGASQTVVGDFNGDGRADMARDNGGGNWYICLSTGTDFSCNNRAAHFGGFAGNMAADFNGDGLTDLAAYTGTGQNWHVCLSTGAGFDCSFWTGNSIGASQSFAADFNGDGKSDLARYNNNGTWYICYSNGKDFVCGSYVGHAGGYSNNVVGDFNGDGKVDLGGYTGNGTNWHMTLSSAGIRDRIVSISTPYEQDVFLIEYKRLTDASVYTKDGGVNAAILPIFDVQYPLQVVSAVTKKTGNGSVVVRHEYGGLKQDPATGRGTLGFRWIKETNLSTGIEEATDFAQEWPLTGMVKRTVARLPGAGNNGILKVVNNTLVYGQGSTSYSKFPFVSQSVEESWDLNGAQFPTVTSSYQYGQDPQYGDPTQISVTSGSVTKTTVHEYWPRSAFGANAWIIGRMKSVTVTSTKP